MRDNRLDNESSSQKEVRLVGLRAHMAFATFVVISTLGMLDKVKCWTILLSRVEMNSAGDWGKRRLGDR
jgi:hypothetical protein